MLSRSCLDEDDADDEEEREAHRAIPTSGGSTALLTAVMMRLDSALREGTRSPHRNDATFARWLNVLGSIEGRP